MKKIIIFVILAIVCQGMFLYAQAPNFTNESEYYFFNFTIERIYPHTLGYVVFYRTTGNIIANTFLPREWFSGSASTGAMAFLRSGTEWPSMSVFYRNGEFSHVLLRVRANRAHQTWGMIPMNINVDEHFQNVTEPRLRF